MGSNWPPTHNLLRLQVISFSGDLLRGGLQGDGEEGGDMEDYWRREVMMARVGKW